MQYLQGLPHVFFMTLFSYNTFPLSPWNFVWKVIIIRLGAAWFFVKNFFCQVCCIKRVLLISIFNFSFIFLGKSPITTTLFKLFTLFYKIINFRWADLSLFLRRGSAEAASPVPVQRCAGVRQVQGGQQGREVHLPAQVAHTPIRGGHWSSKDKFTFQLLWHLSL